MLQRVVDEFQKKVTHSSPTPVVSLTERLRESLGEKEREIQREKRKEFVKFLLVSLLESDLQLISFELFKSR